MPRPRTATCPSATRAGAVAFGVLALGCSPVVLQAQVPPRPAPPAVVTAEASGTFVREALDRGIDLPDTQVSAIAQTPDGYLWLGTRRGLVRFDGLGTTVYSPDNTAALPSWSVNALTADRTGALWISTDRGLTVLERGRFRRVATSEIPARTVWGVMRDRQGRVWASGAFGVRVGDGTRFTAVPRFDEHIYTVAEDARGRMWFGGRRVLASYAPGDTAPIRWAGASDLRVFDLAFGPGQQLWIGERAGIRQLDVTDPQRIVERARVSTAVGAARAQVWSLDIGSDGAVWMGTDARGVLRYDNGVLRALDPPSGLPADPVWWIAHDSRGNRWAGTSGGLVRYRRSPFHTFTDGLTAPGTWAVTGDRDGTPWMTGEDGQVAWFDGAVWHPIFRNLVNMSAPSIWPAANGGMLVADANGRLWRATKAGVQDITSTTPLTAVPALGLFQDADGTLYSNSDGGLLRSNGGRVDSVFRALGLGPGDEPRVFRRDARGTLLVGGPYLTVGEGAQRRRYGPAEGLTDPEVMAVHEAGGALFIATADSGLFVLRNGRVKALGRANARLRHGINGLVDDTQGYLWLTSRTGLMRAALPELLAAADNPGRGVAVRTFTRNDGLPTTDINADYQNRLYRDAQGHLWLPTYAGPVHFDPASIIDEAIPPQVHIEAVAIDGERQARLDSVLAASHPQRVDVTFAATNALVPSRVRAQYRVMGIDDGWVNAGARRTITVGPLPGGRYTVEIRVAGEDGAWQPQLATVSITVPMTLTERAWFVPGLVLTVVLGGYGLARWRLAQARTREARLAALVAERTAALEASRAQLEERVAERTAALGRELEERYRLEQRLESARRLASLGRLAGGVSHEINNALTTVLGFSQLAQLATRHDPRVHDDLGEVVRAGRRAANITQQLLAFARQHHTALAPVALATVVRDTMRSLQQMCAPLTVTFADSDDVPTVHADGAQVEQLLVNLVKNARDARPTDGRIAIALEPRTLETAQAVGDRVLPAGRYAVLSVADRGAGIPLELRDQLFEPFFTTKPINEGTGLGLAVVQGIVARHDGAIEVDSAPGVGTTLRVWFPENAGVEVVTPHARDMPGTGCTVLLAEDDESIRQFATRMLRAHGYRVLDAEDGAAATALVGKAIESIDLVLTDVLMPSVNGLELARVLRAARPELPVLFMTGYAGLDEASLAELRATGAILAKPFTQEALLDAVARALEGARPVAAGGG